MYRYFENVRKTATYHFRYSTVSIPCPDKDGDWFHAEVRKYQKARASVLKKERWFRKRWKARDWAYKQFCKMKKVPFNSLHRKKEVTPELIERGKRLQELKRLKKNSPTIAQVVSNISGLSSIPSINSSPVSVAPAGEVFRFGRKVKKN